MNIRKWLCSLTSKGKWLYKVCDCKRYESAPPIPPEPPVPPPPPAPPWPQAPDHDGHLIGTTAYSLIKYPIGDIEWFLRELVAAGGNATEALFVTTWDDTWRWQPYAIDRWETRKWADKPWTPKPDYSYPVFNLTRWDERVWVKWEAIFRMCQKMNVTIIVRVQDYCSRKDNFLERHWAFWSNVQSWRWGGSMSGGYLRWPIGEGFIWPHYDALNKRLIETLNASGCKYYLEPWNELSVTKGAEYDPAAPDELTINVNVHEWFIESFKRHGCNQNSVICNPQQHKRGSPEYLDHVHKLVNLGVVCEHHGCASPETMGDYITWFGAGRKLFPNGDGTDGHAQGINDGRPNYTEPSHYQAIEMGAIIKNRNLFGYIYKNRSLRNKPSLKSAKFMALAGLAEGME